MKVKFIKWLIRLLLTGYHLSHNPTKKIKESHFSAPSVQFRQGDSGLVEPVRMED